MTPLKNLLDSYYLKRWSRSSTWNAARNTGCPPTEAGLGQARIWVAHLPGARSVGSESLTKWRVSLVLLLPWSWPPSDPVAGTGTGKQPVAQKCRPWGKAGTSFRSALLTHKDGLNEKREVRARVWEEEREWARCRSTRACAVLQKAPGPLPAARHQPPFPQLQEATQDEGAVEVSLPSTGCVPASLHADLPCVLTCTAHWPALQADFHWMLTFTVHWPSLCADLQSLPADVPVCCSSRHYQASSTSRDATDWASTARNSHSPSPSHLVWSQGCPWGSEDSKVPLATTIRKQWRKNRPDWQAGVRQQQQQPGPP